MELTIVYVSEAGNNDLDRFKDKSGELLEADERNKHYYKVRNFRSHSVRIPMADLPRR